MTAYFLDLASPTQRAIIACDIAGVYSSPATHHRPLGFANKVIAFPHLRGAMIGTGIYEIHVAAAAALMVPPGGA